MKCQVTLLGTVAAAICFARAGTAQQLFRVYSPQSYADVGTATNYRLGITPFFDPSSSPAGVGVVPSSTYCGPGPMYGPGPVYIDRNVPNDDGPAYGPSPFVPGQPLRNRLRARTWE